MKSMRAPLLGLLLAGCGAPALEESVAASDATTLPPPALSAARGASRDHLPSDRIYYDLMRYDWYARAEPLEHEGVPYQPAGMPVSAPLGEMAVAGTFQGVDYYRRSGADGVLFVPVFDGYWLAFRATRMTHPGAD